MKISLDDPIWHRLYGPYGVEDIPKVLRQLSDGWDDAIAENLFWEKLHHQYDLYPVTYAAFPWLWDMAHDRKSSKFTFFCAHVLFCANVGNRERGRSTYRGLSLNVPDHVNPFSKTSEKLDALDMTKLANLEHWFTKTSPSIARLCAKAIPEDDAMKAASLSAGIAATCGAIALAEALSIWSEGQDIDYVLDTLIDEEEDLSRVGETRKIIGNRNKSIQEVLEILNEFWSLDG